VALSVASRDANSVGLTSIISRGQFRFLRREAEKKESTFFCVHLFTQLYFTPKCERKKQNKKELNETK